MSKKLIATILAILGVTVLIAVISAASSNRESAAEESSSAAEVVAGTEMLIIPSEMPEGITFEVPAGFTETSSPYYDKYYILNDASVIFTGDTLPDYNQTAESFAEGVKQQYEQTADNFRLLSEETVQLTTLSGKLLEFTYDIVGSESSQSMECTTAIFVKNGKVYLITCKSHQDTYSGYRNIFRRMIESVVITGETGAATLPEDTLTEPQPEAQQLPDETVAPAG